MLAGFVLFIMSGGGPWSTAGTMNAVMGRDVRMGLGGLIVAHFALALIYTGVIGSLVYRLRLWGAIAVGAAAGIGLYFVNMVIFRALQTGQQSPELRPILVHIVFGVLSAALYKAFSVPRPIRTGADAAKG